MGRLAPSGGAFLPELSTIAAAAVAAATVLRARLASAIGERHHRAELATYAHQAQTLAAAVTTGVPRTLVPPIDGEDAAELASRLRVVVDGVHRAGRLADLVRPDLSDANVAHLADLLVQATDSLEGAVATLMERTGALDFASDVRRLAGGGDRAHGEAMGALLASAPDPLGAVRQVEMYDALRDSLGDCSGAVAVVERIVLKRF
jgi:uncharacterized protein Yka (UPF0111/DUF47 family)